MAKFNFGRARKARQSKLIGKALEAKVLIPFSSKLDLFDSVVINNGNSPMLKESVNISQLVMWDVDKDTSPLGVGKVLTDSELQQARSEGFFIKVVHADGQKCERCWHWEADIGQNAQHSTICGRCVEAVMQFKA